MRRHSRHSASSESSSPSPPLSSRHRSHNHSASQRHVKANQLSSRPYLSHRQSRHNSPLQSNPPPQHLSSHKSSNVNYQQHFPRKVVDCPTPDSQQECRGRRTSQAPRCRDSHTRATRRTPSTHCRGGGNCSPPRRSRTRLRSRRRRSQRGSNTSFSSSPRRPRYPPRRVDRDSSNDDSSDHSSRRQRTSRRTPDRRTRHRSRRNRRMLSSRRDSPQDAPNYQQSRSKRPRTPADHPEMSNGRSGISREKRHRWMTPEDFSRQDQWAESVTPYKSTIGQQHRQVYISPPPTHSRAPQHSPPESTFNYGPLDMPLDDYYRQCDRSSFQRNNFHDSSPQQQHQWHPPQSTPTSSQHPTPHHTSRRPSPHNDHPQPSDAYYRPPQHQPPFDQRDRRYRNHHQQQRQPSPLPYQQQRPLDYRDYDRHRRSRRPSPWRRAHPYFLESVSRRKGRAGGDVQGNWDHLNRQDDYQRPRNRYAYPPSSPSWKSSRRVDHQQNAYRNDRYNNRHQQRPWNERQWNREKPEWKPEWMAPSTRSGNAANKYRHEEESRNRRPHRSLSHRSPSVVRSSKKQKSTKNDDEIVHFEWLPGMSLSRRYVVVSQLGEGTFGRVVECEDVDTGKRVAVKVVRDISRYTSAAQIEAEILEEVREKDPENQSNCVILIERFLYDRRRGRERRSSSLRRQHRKRSRPQHINGRCQSEESSVNNQKDQHQRHRHHSSDKSTTRSSSDENQYGAGIHMCLVSEKLGLSLFAFLSQNHYRGFFVEDIQQISLEVLKALAFLRKIKLTHTDLKPENILFVDDASDRVVFPRSRYPARFWDGDASDVSDDDGDESSSNNPSGADPSPHAKLVYTDRPRDCRVKLIDFGSATFEDDSHCSLINTRQYRAPEVMLQIGWSTPSDLWCLGCILMELYTGVLLFRTHEHLEHLALMERIVGPIPQSVLQDASSTGGAKYISKIKQSDGRLRLDWPEGASNQKSVERVKNCRPLDEMVLPCHRLFADFIRYLLQIDPSRRPTPTEAMRHPFLKSTLPEC